MTDLSTRLAELKAHVDAADDWDSLRVEPNVTLALIAIAEQAGLECYDSGCGVGLNEHGFPAGCPNCTKRGKALADLEAALGG